jgi:hypothetical protein
MFMISTIAVFLRRFASSTEIILPFIASLPICLVAMGNISNVVFFICGQTAHMPPY